MYTEEKRVQAKIKSQKAQYSEDEEDLTDLLHRKLEHIGMKSLEKMNNLQMVDGIEGNVNINKNSFLKYV